MAQPPKEPYDPTQYYADKPGENFRGVLPSRDVMDSGDWNVDGMDVVGYRKWHEFQKDPETSSEARERIRYMADPARQQWPIAEWADMDTDTNATPRAMPSFSHPAVSLPLPTLMFDFRMSVTLNPVVVVGSAPSGLRRWVSFTGGSWSGSFGSGIVQPGGQDIQLITPTRSAKLSTNYLLQTHDSPPAYIMAKTTGWRTGPAEVLEALDDPERADDVDPRTYKFRIFVELETGDARYGEKVNTGMWVGSGMRKGSEVLYDAYRVT